MKNSIIALVLVNLLSFNINAQNNSNQEIQFTSNKSLKKEKMDTKNNDNQSFNEYKEIETAILGLTML